MSNLRYNPYGAGRLSEPKELNYVAVMPDAPNVIEGVELIDAVMPVNTLTGQRSSVFDFLKLATGAKSDLVAQLVQALPTISSDPALSDSDRVSMVAARLASGTPAEDARLVQVLSENADILFRNNPELKEPVQVSDPENVNSTIQFDPENV